MIKKIFTGFVAIATIFSMAMSFSSSAVAAETTVMQQTTTVSTSYTFNTNLTVGSTGADVVALQSILVGKGFLVMPAGVSMGYFGGLTRAALASFQASVGISPAVGYFGPITRAYMNTHSMTSTSTTTTTTVPGCAPGAMFSSTTGARCDTTTLPAGCTSTAGFSPTTGARCDSGSTTSGGSTSSNDEGRLTGIETTGGTDSSVEEGDNDAKVLAVKLEAKDSDVTIQRVDVEFDLSGISDPASQNLDHYVDSVSLWLGTTKLASQDVDEADEDNDVFSFRFDGLKGMIDEDDSERLYVAVNAAENVDSEDMNEDITVRIPEDGIRAAGENGVSDTYDNADLEDEFSIVEQGVGDLSITSNSDDNKDMTVEADDSDTTEGVTLLTFDLDSDDLTNTVNEITVHLATTSATSTRVDDIVDTLYLFADGEEVGSEAVSGAGTADVTFDDLDLDIDEDGSVTFVVKADINEVDGSFHEGAGVSATVDGDDVDAEDENGEDVDVSGSANGGDISFRSEGIQVTFVSASEAKDTADAAPDLGTFTIKFKVKAFGDDAYIIDNATNDEDGTYTAGEGAIYSTSGTSTNRGDLTSTASDEGATFLVNEGDEETFTLVVTADGNNSFEQVMLEAVEFNDENNTTSTSYESGFDSEDFQTDPLFLSAL